MNTRIKRKTTTEIVAMKVPEGKSLYILDKDNKIRKFLFELVLGNKFEGVIMIAILVSTVSLIFQNPLEDPSEPDQRFWQAIDLYTTIIFTVEMLLKIMAYGLICNGEDSYLRVLGNCFDCSIVISALAS